MPSIIRIALGIAVVIGAFFIKGKASPGEGGEGVATTFYLFGNQVSPLTVNLVFGAFAIAGVVMIALGVMGLVKRGQ